MMQVILALLPGTALMTYWFGSGVIVNILVLTLTSVLCEAAAQTLRQRNVKTALGDGSMVLAAWLLALCLPPNLPLLQLVVGAISMAFLGKHLFGGLGQNPFNPAMVGYTLLLISFPKTMTTWPNPLELTDSIVASSQWDAITQATPLDRLRGLQRQGLPTDNSSVSIWPWNQINIAWLLGGLFLMWRGIVRWHIPIAMLITATLAHSIHYVFFETTTLPPTSMMLSGAMMLGAFFIATDPVTAPSSKNARVLYGAGIGLLTVILRQLSNYPEGIAFAVLLMNSAVPLLDRWFVRDTKL